MIVDGVKITSLSHLESLGLSEESFISLKTQFLKEIEPTQFQKDEIKYTKRAAVKDQIMIEMATENMQRVRSGLWSTAQLINLTQDAELKLIQDDISSLSFELAVMKLTTVANPLITSDIKLGWIKKLQSHFYL